MQKKLQIGFDRRIELTAEDYNPVIPDNGDFWRQISVLTATEPREETTPYFMMGIASYPAFIPGEVQVQYV